MPLVIGIIQARLASQRLPAKILAPIAGRPLLGTLAERLRPSQIDEWWLATTDLPGDDVTAAWGDELGLHVWRGDENDVLSRFTGIIRNREPDWILRVTADDPFNDAALVDTLLAALPEAEKEANLVGIGDGERALPLGYGVELARASAVLKSESEIPPDQPWHRSHVLSWLHARSALYLRALPPSWPCRPGWRWTVDTDRDLEMARAAFATFGDHWAEIRYPEMVAALDARPDIIGINRDVAQKHVREG